MAGMADRQGRPRGAGNGPPSCAPRETAGMAILVDCFGAGGDVRWEEGREEASGQGPAPFQRSPVLAGLPSRTGRRAAGKLDADRQ